MFSQLGGFPYRVASVGRDRVVRHDSLNPALMTFLGMG